jgi:hypothetical protein
MTEAMEKPPAARLGKRKAFSTFPQLDDGDSLSQQALHESTMTEQSNGVP